MIKAAILSNRGILKVGGADRVSFLQGLLTNDVSRLSPQNCLYSLMLSPQGKYQYDLFLIDRGDEIWLEVDKNRLDDLRKRLTLYKLRSDVTLDGVPEKTILTLWGPNVPESLELEPREGASGANDLWAAFMDPRLMELGARLVVDVSRLDKLAECLGITLMETGDYEYHRLCQGVPESGNEFIVDKSIPLECGMDELNAIDWDKGCYVGQELTARTRYRGLVRKRLVPMILMGPVDPDKPIMSGDREVGVWYARCHDRGLALVRVEALGESMHCDGIEVIPHIPQWVRLPEQESESSDD